jgi:sterol desaturase/sphingolipid hydroxylase (fatty acid hydroxylase superfamily)
VAEWLLEKEPFVRVFAFAVVLVVAIGSELLLPRRSPSNPRGPRWRGNLALSILDTVLVRVLLPFGLTGAALWCERRDIGIFSAIGLPPFIRFLMSFAVLDLIVYLQHRVSHAVPVLWRFHQVHHSDEDVDATTGVRFHPIEILLSLVLKTSVMAIIGAPPLAVLLFEVVLNAGSVATHTNVDLPRPLDALLRLMVVTPDMHRVHHSVRREEQSANFGFNFSWWDRLFRTYRAQPAVDHATMPLGVTGIEPPASITELLLLPWYGPSDSAAPIESMRDNAESRRR